MKLSRVHSTKELCAWFRAHGLSPSENAYVDHVDDVHAPGSWHYKKGSPGVYDRNGQGTCAIDLNDNDVRDTKWYQLRRGHWRLHRPQSETEALDWAYNKVKRAQQRKHWPLAEAFFNRRGYKDDYGWGVNVPISGHATHAHFGFTRDRW